MESIIYDPHQLLPTEETGEIPDHEEEGHENVPETIKEAVEDAEVGKNR